MTPGTRDQGASGGATRYGRTSKVDDPLATCSHSRLYIAAEAEDSTVYIGAYMYEHAGYVGRSPHVVQGVAA